MDSQSLSEFNPVHPEALRTLLIKLIIDQGGSVTVHVPTMIAQVTDATWMLAAEVGPGPYEGTWTVERIDAPDHG